jgi:cobalt-zinc-cadmium efflux system outer membrane protein
MKFPIFWVFLLITLFMAEYAMPKSSFAAFPSAKLDQPQDTLTENTSAELTEDKTADPLTLEWVLDAAVKNYPSLKSTWHAIKARQGKAQQSGLPANPILFGEFEEFGGSGDYSGTDAMTSKIGISQEFQLGGKIKNRIRAAETAIRIADLEHQVEIIEVTYQVKKRFFEVFALQELLNLQEEQVKLIRQVHEVVTKRVKAGDTSSLDLPKSQVELAMAEVEVEQTRKKIKAAKYVLASSWGAQFPRFSKITAQYKPVPNYTEAELKEAIKQSPAWYLMEAQLSEANAALNLALSERFPDLELAGGIQHFNETDDHAFLLGINIPLPIFNRNQGGIAEARALARKAQYEREAGYLELFAQLQDAWQNLASSQKAVQSLESRVLPVAQSSYESINKAYKAGELDILSLLDAQRTWIETRRTHLDLLRELESSRIEIERLIGKGIVTAPALSPNNNDTAREGLS